LERFRDHDLGYAKVDEIDDEDGYACYAGDEKFVPPSNIEEVVADT